MEFRFADCVLDDARLVLFRDGQQVAVEPQVFDLLVLLVRNPDRVITRDELIEVVWRGRIVSDSAISARIAAARRAVGDDGKRQTVIRTVARRGVQMATQVQTDAPAPEGAAAPASPEVQRIRYARNTDGHLIAYASYGRGPGLIEVESGISHLELSWAIPCERSFFDRLIAQHLFVRYDPLGSGLSSAAHVDLARDFAGAAEDVIAVADAAGLEQFALVSRSGACLTAIQTAARHPDRVTKLVITGGYVTGRTARAPGPDPMRQLIVSGWDPANISFAAGLMTSYFPDGPAEHVMDYAQLFTQASDQSTALIERDRVNSADVQDLLPRISCPTLVMHGRRDAVHPLSEARKLVAGIRGAELVILETANNFPLPGGPAWETYIETLLAFLAE
ncbi:alpha/beta hydrolase [Seohaeicola saemankumensis]|nr:winged helix-turn-helix domain-containing protein [Seohaeicola saemankumensis]MCA0871883.1 alpha/beta hydrolase [Seohaeicola saemankumensis]